MCHLQNLEPHSFLPGGGEYCDSGNQILVAESLLAGCDDVLAGATDRDLVTEAFPHGLVVRREAERDPVETILVLGHGVRAVVDVHDPHAAGTTAECAVGRDVKHRNGEQRRRVVRPCRLLARLQRAALDLQTGDGTDRAHIAI